MRILILPFKSVATVAWYFRALEVKPLNSTKTVYFKLGDPMHPKGSEPYVIWSGSEYHERRKLFNFLGTAFSKPIFNLSR